MNEDAEAGRFGEQPHIYPRYGLDLMRMMADTAVEDFVDSFSGRIIGRLAGFKTLP